MHYLNCLDGITNFEESKSILQNKGLVVKEYESLYLVKYVKGKSDMKDSDVQKCRGIILEKNSNKLLCVPPQKSIDNDYYHNLQGNDQFNSDIVFEEFIDGTMINLFYDETISQWQLATRSTVGANTQFFVNKNRQAQGVQAAAHLAQTLSPT